MFFDTGISEKCRMRTAELVAYRAHCPNWQKGNSRKKKQDTLNILKETGQGQDRHCYSSAYCTGKTDVRYADYFSMFMFNASKSIFLFR